MKLLLLCLFSVFVAKSSWADGEREQYDQLLSQARRSNGAVYTGVDGHKWRHWAGLRTKTGLIIAIDEIVASYRDRTGEIDSGRMVFAWWMFKNNKLAEDEVLEVVLENARKHQGDPDTLIHHFGILDRFDYDEKILQEVVSYLSDTRNFRALRRRRDLKTFDVTYEVRVCDVARTSAMVWLGKHKIWDLGYPEYEEYTHVSTIAGKNRLIRKINEILLEHGSIQYAVHPDDPVPRDRHGRAVNEKKKEAKPRHNSPPRQKDGKDKSSDNRFLWGTVGVSLLILMCCYVWFKHRAR